MEHGFIDRYSGISSCVHGLDARTKILAVLLYIVAVVTTPPLFLLAFIIYAGLLAWAVEFSRVPWRHVLSRAALVLPFSVFVAVGLPFMGSQKTVVVIGLHLSEPGLWILAGAVMKSFLSVAALVLLVSTTSFAHFLAGLMHFRFSSFVIDVFALAYRYLFVLIDEAMRLRRAAAARGYRPTWLSQARGVGHLIGALFVRSYGRSERIYGAMRLRGYNGDMPYAALPAYRTREGAGLVLLAAMFVAVRLWAR